MSRFAQPGPVVNDTTTMKDWITFLGWNYIGNCECRSNKMRFNNSNHPTIEIWISQAGDRMEFRKMFGRDSKIRGTGTKQDYQQAYDYWIVQGNLKH